MLTLRFLKVLGVINFTVASVAGVAFADTTQPLATPDGIGPLINAEKTLATRMDSQVDTWFVTSHFKADGHTLSCFYHVILMPGPDGKPVIQSVVAITDQTKGWFRSGDIVLPFKDDMVGKPGLIFKLANGEIDLTTRDIHIRAALPDGSFDIQMQPVSPVLYYGGTGVIPILGMTLNEYAIPELKTTGSITIEGRTYNVDGVSWLDREWQNDLGEFGGKKWSWMSLNLDNGDALIVYSTPDPTTNKPRAWTTILHHNGSQTVTVVEPSLGAADDWVSKSGNRYPTRWVVRIPLMHAVLNVVPSPRQQEIASVVPALTKYEGASAVTGTYDGKPVKGFGYVELYGNWK
jgi:predicted secreted hydrolase